MRAFPCVLVLDFGRIHLLPLLLICPPSSPALCLSLAFKLLGLLFPSFHLGEKEML